MAANDREFEIVLWGATGFTGRLVAEYLHERHGTQGALRWALGGRNEAKLHDVREALGAELPLVVGDAGDPAFVASMAERTRVVCTTVGPYAAYGSPLVAACARAGTDYCDLTGELHWIHRMLLAHEKEARASGARIVPTCGFDSIPSDLGAFFVQREMRRRAGRPSPHVKCAAAGFRGGMSGGTIASMLGMMEEAEGDPEITKILRDPYALNPDDRPRGPDAPDRTGPAHDEDLGQWTAPFVMAGINTRIVRRSAALLPEVYGDDFLYEESMLTGSGPAGALKAAGVSLGMGAGMAAMAIGPIRRLVAPRLPSPGEGPSPEEREHGYWELRFWAAPPPGGNASALRARLTGDRDPGYGSTSKMLAESALSLARDERRVEGGFWTPASALGDALVERLTKSAGVTFEVTD